jgi:hypothetical protein
MTDFTWFYRGMATLADPVFASVRRPTLELKAQWHWPVTGQGRTHPAGGGNLVTGRAIGPAALP